MRTAGVKRDTNETKIALYLNLDGTGVAAINVDNLYIVHERQRPSIALSPSRASKRATSRVHRLEVADAGSSSALLGGGAALSPGRGRRRGAMSLRAEFRPFDGRGPVLWVFPKHRGGGGRPLPVVRPQQVGRRKTVAAFRGCGRVLLRRAARASATAQRRSGARGEGQRPSRPSLSSCIRTGARRFRC